MASNNQASHAEVWDDSMLVNSWNDAVEEYKRYHSIQALGEDVDELIEGHELHNETMFASSINDIPKDHSQDSCLLSSASQTSHNQILEKKLGQDQLEEASTADQSSDTKPSTAPQANETSSSSNQIADHRSTKPPALPHHLIGQGETDIRYRDVHGDLLTRGSFHAVNDDGLKNLLMSWYYAGEILYGAL
ncbi:hypothetical protein GLAREA_05283 [Glarea lozoyensis ATCC 20868]|uniref:Survival Motor Neuron Gemin2-binding domain-containing protein n=1 Tax=Glarea lozoyensis (strain ATCC 20868 / MF5171) TaxID=1116229 RepID=S3DDW2_GLAL2|nr:uncharacterized protein GLAREA_05283 [Glarea lozoyensis ATCC 20868]EPE35945.1 hypothetical protein GLAREA_05283 [Glarea lozoyensis ATCC 20868]